MGRPDVEAPGTVGAGRALVEQSKSIVAPGSLPTRTNTVIAEVLSRTLGGQKLTDMAGVTDALTTRLAARIGDLEGRMRGSGRSTKPGAPPCGKRGEPNTTLGVRNERYPPSPRPRPATCRLPTANMAYTAWPPAWCCPPSEQQQAGPAPVQNPVPAPTEPLQGAQKQQSPTGQAGLSR